MTVTTGFDSDQALASLSAFEILPEWLAAGMYSGRVSSSLEQHAAPLVDGSVTLVSCKPKRLRAKAEQWIPRYELEVAKPGGAPEEVVLVGRLWAPDQTPPESVTSPSNDADPWTCWLPDLRLELHGEESDEALPALNTLTDPTLAAQFLEPVIRAAGYTDATIESCETNVVRYKPTSRCTTVVPITYAEGTTGPSPVVLKTHVGDKGSTAWDAMKQLWDRPETWRDTVLLAEPLAFDEEEKILVQGPIPEAMTLKELARNAIREGDPQMLDTLREELAKTGRALAAIHASGAVYQRTITFEDELAEVQDIIDRLALTVPSLKGAGTELLEQLTAAARQVPAGDLVPAHHDFRPAQVLLHDGEIGFIDFDGASMAEPALDLGRFRAKLRDIGISTLTFKGEMLSGEPLEKNLALLDDLCDTYLAAYQEHGQVSTQRVLLWEACDLMTGMLHAWTKVRLMRLDPRLVILKRQLGLLGG
ncbi:MAG: phosphotransferase [Aeromicrobium sp.]